MNVDTEGRPVPLIMLLEVPHEEAVCTILGFWDGSAGISHGTSFKVISDKIDHRDGPESVVFSNRTWLDLTVLGGLVVIGVGPETWITELESGSGALVLEASCLQDFVHGVPSGLEEGGAKTFNVGCGNPSKVGHLLTLVHDFRSPHGCVQITPVGGEGAVGDAVESDLMTISPHIVNLGVVSVLMGDVEGPGDGVSIGILPVGVEDLLVEWVVLDCDRIVES